MQKLVRIMVLGMLVAPLALSGCCHKHHDDRMTGKMQQEYGSK